MIEEDYENKFHPPREQNQLHYFQKFGSLVFNFYFLNLRNGILTSAALRLMLRWEYLLLLELSLYLCLSLRRSQRFVLIAESVSVVKLIFI